MDQQGFIVSTLAPSSRIVPIAQDDNDIEMRRVDQRIGEMPIRNRPLSNNGNNNISLSRVVPVDITSR